jgi:hypothetical protein
MILVFSVLDQTTPPSIDSGDRRELFCSPMIRLFTPLRILTAGFLFWAAANHSHNYYVFLRWLVFLVALFGAYRAYHEAFDKWFLVCFQLALAIVFNPPPAVYF